MAEYQPEQDLNHNHVKPGHRYTCHNSHFHPVQSYTMQSGWTQDGRRNMIKVETRWIPIVCGHTYRETDPNCQDCHRRF